MSSFNEGNFPSTWNDFCNDYVYFDKRGNNAFEAIVTDYKDRRKEGRYRVLTVTRKPPDNIHDDVWYVDALNEYWFETKVETFAKMQSIKSLKSWKWMEKDEAEYWETMIKLWRAKNDE